MACGLSAAGRALLRRAGISGPCFCICDLQGCVSAEGNHPALRCVARLRASAALKKVPAFVTPRPAGASRSAKHRLVIAVVVGSLDLAHRTGPRLKGLPDAAGTIAGCPSRINAPSKPCTPVVVEVAGIEPASDAPTRDFVQPWWKW